MATSDSNVLNLAPDAGTPVYRSAQHNIEAEQSLLGAILVNNDAFYRVSDFLEPKHFFEPIHHTIFETAGSLIRMGKVATPVTLKTFVPAETDIGGMTVGQYLARLAAEATTIINAQDYGRTIYELALRRDLIRIGEDMVNVAYNVAKAHRAEVQADGTMKSVNGGVVGFFSCEMSAEQLATRIIAERTGIPSSTIRRGGITESDFEKIRDYSIELQSLPFYVDETGGLSISQLTARARRLKRQKGLDLLVIDYIQLLQGTGRRIDNRVQEVTEITTSLKALAKELNVPILALSQLSRQVESRDDNRPQLSDLRESGSIEQHHDLRKIVFREEYYLANKEPRIGTPEYEKWQLDLSLVHGKAEIIIGKQRHGPTGTVEVQFEGQFTRFSDLAPDG